MDGLIASKKYRARRQRRTMVASARIGHRRAEVALGEGDCSQGAGDLEQAVTIGAHVQRRLENLVAALGGAQG